MSEASCAYTKAALTSSTHPGNNFDAMRIAAAMVVMITHHHALTGIPEPRLSGTIHSYAGLAVAVFFIISGYLVTASWQRDPHLLRFALRRFLRVWPAFIVVLLLTVYGLGVWATELPLKEYLAHSATTDYLRGLWLHIHFMLPGVFTHNPYPFGVNGSLWTIPIEIQCYAVLGLAGMVGLLLNRSIFLLSIAIFMLWFHTRSNADLVGDVNYERELSAYFLSGAAMHALREYWRRRPLAWTIAIGTASVAAWWLDWRYTSLLIGMPFAVIYLGTQATPIIRRAGRWGDPSYGIYLFAFPIQQLVILHLWPTAGFVGTLAAAAVITVALAYISWHLIEKQAMRFKPSTPKPANDENILKKLLPMLKKIRLLEWFWPVLAGSVGLIFIIRQFNAPIQVDPTYTYLPAARALLEQGWSFFLTAQSYEVTPLAYLWPALWGVDPQWIRLANAGLWISSVYFLWKTSCLLGGIRAGAVAMLLLLSPELVRYFPSEMTEPLYLFGLFGWMHAMARMVIGREKSTTIILQSAVMLTITLLSRPVLQLITPTLLISCIACVSYWKISQKIDAAARDWQPTITAIGWSLAFALVLPMALVIKNGVVFGLWGLGTGSGTGIYLGTHPLFQGAEPPFLGFNYDINALISLVANTGSHLTIAGDRAARDAALWQIQSMDMGSAAAFFARKLWWWLAHHPAQVEFYGQSLRTLRITEILVMLTSIFWIAAFWTRRKSSALISSIGNTRQITFVTFLLMMFAAMVVQLLPILYNSRYSSNLLDPWIIPLTAFGISALLSPIKFRGIIKQSHLQIRLTSSHGASLWRPVAVTLVILTSIAAVQSATKKYEAVAIDPLTLGEVETHLEIKEEKQTTTYGMKALGDKEWEAVESPFSIQMHVDSNDIQRLNKSDIFNAMWETELLVTSGSRSCRKAEISYQTENGDILQPTNKQSLLLNLKRDDSVQLLVTHANQELRPKVAGSLRIVMQCPLGTRVKWHGTRLLESRHFAKVAERIKSQKLP